MLTNDDSSMNFALIMFLLLVFTGAIWLLDYWVLRRRRPAGQADPWWVEYPKSFFPVILVVFLLRSFLVEPFKIPSGSMLPTLLVGDFILVNKFTYGIRLPVVNKKVVDIDPVRRGDVVVFRYPADPSVDYIKRVIGLPGDRVQYRGKRLSVNGEPVAAQSAGFYTDAEVRDIVHYAAERFIDVVPEIDIPGHSQAAIAAYPWLGVTGKRPRVSTDWGINTWLLKPDARSVVVEFAGNHNGFE